MLHKRLRPQIIMNADPESLCAAIDFIKTETKTPLRPREEGESVKIQLGKESRERLLSDLQERLLLVSHYQIQELLAIPTII